MPVPSAFALAWAEAQEGRDAILCLRPPEKQDGPSDPYASQLRTASALHAKAWGKPWPQSDGTISGDEMGLVDDEDDDDVDGAFADKLKVPSEFEYRYLEEIRTLKSALGANPGEDEEDFLVVRKEYEILREGLEDESKYNRAIVMTGHPGIGSYETWF